MRCALLCLCVLTSREAAAQCGANRSSCSGCHDGARAASPGDEAWHANHAFADLCPTCHGGRGDATDLTLAHAGLVDPLASPEAQCGSCHGAASATLAQRYQGPPDRDAGAPTAAGGGGASTPAHPPAARPPPHGEPTPNLVLASLVTVLGALGVAYVVRNERTRGGHHARPDPIG